MEMEKADWGVKFPFSILIRRQGPSLMGELVYSWDSFLIVNLFEDGQIGLNNHNENKDKKGPS